MEPEDGGKIFGIGLGRTGTKSLATALGLLGYEVVYGPVRHGRTLWEYFGNAMFDPPLIGGVDGWLDEPIPRYFAQLDEKWPGSRFILTTRSYTGWKSSWDRLRSKMDHPRTLGSPDYSLQLFTAGATRGCMPFDKARMRWDWRSHHHLVRWYFQDRPDDLLELPLEAEDKWERLCTFLGKAHPGVPYPHKYKSEEQE